MHDFTLLKTDLALLGVVRVRLNLVLLGLMIDLVVPHDFEEDIDGLVWRGQNSDG